jgi:glycosidase
MRFRLLITIAFFCMFGSTVSACGSPAVGESEPTSDAWVREAVIYELFVRDFSPEGTFQAVIPRLSEIRELGTSVIWLMPIHPIGEVERKGTLGSPYSIRDFFDVNPDFGTKEDFAQLVSAVHAEGMKVIIDLVANHSAWDNPWIEENPEWYVRDEAGNILAPNDDWTDVADLDYDNPETWNAMKRVMRYWVEEFDIDGYRADVAELVPMEFWAEAISDLRSIKPVLMLAEGADPELHSAGFDLSYSWTFYHGLKDVFREESAQSIGEWLLEDSALPRDGLRMRFTTNHDETAWDATPIELFGGAPGARAASVIAYASPGVPLLYNGQEVGSTVQLGLFEKDNIDWLEDVEMRAFYIELGRVYHGHDAFHGDFRIIDAGEDIFAIERTGETSRVVILVNVRGTSAAYEEHVVPEGKYRDALTDVLYTSDASTLPPYGYRVLIYDGDRAPASSE